MAARPEITGRRIGSARPEIDPGTPALPPRPPPVGGISRRNGRRLLTFADLKARGIPFSRVHIRRLERAGKFPQHISLGENSIAWFEDEVDDFLETKAQARRPIEQIETPAPADEAAR